MTTRRQLLSHSGHTAVLAVLASFAGGAIGEEQPEDGDANAAQRARDFLTGMYDGKLGLLPEFRGSDTYWLYHDNYLAAAVLRKTRPDLSEKITRAIRSYGIHHSGKIEIVLGEAKNPLPFRQYELMEVARVEGGIIRSERVTDRPMKGWEEYADLLLLAAMAEPVPEKAAAHFTAARRLWDGHGFADKVLPSAKRYATYKLALALLAARVLKLGFPESGAARRLLLARQEPGGGFITDYTAGGKNVGFANVETTCLAVLALEGR